MSCFLRAAACRQWYSMQLKCAARALEVSLSNPILGRQRTFVGIVKSAAINDMNSHTGTKSLVLMYLR